MPTSLVNQPWFSQRATAAEVLAGVRDLFRNHPEYYVENTVDDFHGRHCALGAIGMYAEVGPIPDCAIAREAIAALAAECPADVIELAAAMAKYGIRPDGVSRSFENDNQKVATASNVIGPAFIADLCDRAIAKLEGYKPESAGVANFVKPKVEVPEMVAA